LKLSITNNKQYRTKRGIYCSNNKLAEQSAKISQLEHKAKEQYVEINALYNKMSGLEIRMERQEQ
jgi:hypothetical protein